MDYPICSSCHNPIVPGSNMFTMDNRIVCMCPERPAILSVGFITINATVWNATVCNKPEEPSEEELAKWSESLKAMREWKATFHGYIGERKPVPSAFQEAFKDGELEP